MSDPIAAAGTNSPESAWSALKRRNGVSGDFEHQFTLHVQALLDLCARGPVGYEMTADRSQVRFANGFRMMHLNILALELGGMITTGMETCQTTEIGQRVLAGLNAELGRVIISSTVGTRPADVFRLPASPQPNLI
jgi:hypothetical protein